MPAKKRFEHLMSSLESITVQLEGEQTDLETSLRLFQEGQGLIQEARKRLSELEHQFTVIQEASSQQHGGPDTRKEHS